MAQASFEPGTFRSRVLRSARCATSGWASEAHSETVTIFDSFCLPKISSDGSTIFSRKWAIWYSENPTLLKKKFLCASHILKKVGGGHILNLRVNKDATIDIKVENTFFHPSISYFEHISQTVAWSVVIRSQENMMSRCFPYRLTL